MQKIIDKLTEIMKLETIEERQNELVEFAKDHFKNITAAMPVDTKSESYNQSACLDNLLNKLIEEFVKRKYFFASIALDQSTKKEILELSVTGLFQENRPINK
jgi:hypothetical protein